MMSFSESSLELSADAVPLPVLVSPLAYPTPTHQRESLIDSPNLDSWNRWNMNDLLVCENEVVRGDLQL